jgi:hypothetical protein
MERVYNIVDMNIIPINVHALMRDIPLANLYNYEYTFEQMVASMYGEQASRYTAAAGAAGAIANPDTRSTRQMFLRLLVDPYLDVATEMYGSDTRDLGSTGYVHRIFRGDNNLGMGRPKFLSDQLFNKVLFGSVYQSRRDFDEAGPAVGIGAARGQAAMNTPLLQAQRILSSFIEYMASARTEFLGAGVVNDAGGLAAATLAAGGAPAVAALRTAVYNWIYRRGGARDRLMEFAAEILPLPEILPNPPQAGVQAIANLLSGGGGAGRNLSTLMGAIDGLSAGAIGSSAGLATAISDGNYDGYVDRLFLTEYNGGGGSVYDLIRVTLNRGTGNSLAEAIFNSLSNTYLPRAPNTTPLDFGNTRWSSGRRGALLTYLKKPADNEPADAVVAEVGLPSFEAKLQLEAIGKERFDTRFIRNIFFITNVVRILRLKLNRELSQSRNVLVASHASVSAGVTEYGSDPFGPNEVIDSTLGGLPRFNDRDNFV